MVGFRDAGITPTYQPNPTKPIDQPNPTSQPTSNPQPHWSNHRPTTNRLTGLLWVELALPEERVAQLRSLVIEPLVVIHHLLVISTDVSTFVFSNVK